MVRLWHRRWFKVFNNDYKLLRTLLVKTHDLHSLCKVYRPLLNLEIKPKPKVLTFQKFVSVSPGGAFERYYDLINDSILSKFKQCPFDLEGTLLVCLEFTCKQNWNIKRHDKWTILMTADKLTENGLLHAKLIHYENE